MTTSAASPRRRRLLGIRNSSTISSRSASAMPAVSNFDHAASDIGAIDAERRDLAKLVLMDVLLAPGDDWYVIPIEQQIGTVMHLDAVCVQDVFGLLTIVPPAAGDQGPWSMFTTSGPPSALGLLLPAGSGAA